MLLNLTSWSSHVWFKCPWIRVWYVGSSLFCTHLPRQIGWLIISCIQQPVARNSVPNLKWYDKGIGSHGNGKVTVLTSRALQILPLVTFYPKSMTSVSPEFSGTYTKSHHFQCMNLMSQKALKLTRFLQSKQQVLRIELAGVGNAIFSCIAIEGILSVAKDLKKMLPSVSRQRLDAWIHPLLKSGKICCTVWN